MRIENVKLPIREDSSDYLYEICLKKSGLKRCNAKYFKILKKSLDARDKGDIRYVYSAEISSSPIEEVSIDLPFARSKKKVVIVGFGPAGMFCALYLARAGYCPIVIERGQSVDERKKSIDRFIRDRVLDENSNIQFGEGGAGAFSDGKLATGVSGVLVKAVLKDLALFGAPKEIEWEAKPHIGSDRLPQVVKNIRSEIERLGGKVMFSTKMTSFKQIGGKICSVLTDKGEIECDDLVLAVGHSARDTFKTLVNSGISAESKPFAVGFRIEHLQDDVSLSQYGEKFASMLPAADYRLSSRKGERGVFTFCMCPGGFVLPSSSESGEVVTNGMSLYARDGKNANSAVLCEVYPSDFSGGILGGVEFQRNFERMAYDLGGKNYSAPIQLLGDFMDGRKSIKLGRVKPTYSIDCTFSDLSAVYGRAITDCLRRGIADMDGKLKGFADKDAVLTGVETRSSSPIRILRGENFASLSFENLYPCGEGCGYAGGITSAAADGIKTARAIAEKYGI